MQMNGMYFTDIFFSRLPVYVLVYTMQTSSNMVERERGFLINYSLFIASTFDLYAASFRSKTRLRTKRQKWKLGTWMTNTFHKCSGFCSLWSTIVDLISFWVMCDKCENIRIPNREYIPNDSISNQRLIQSDAGQMLKITFFFCFAFSTDCFAYTTHNDMWMKSEDLWMQVHEDQSETKGERGRMEFEVIQNRIASNWMHKFSTSLNTLQCAYNVDTQCNVSFWFFAKNNYDNCIVDQPTKIKQQQMTNTKQKSANKRKKHQSKCALLIDVTQLYFDQSVIIYILTYKMCSSRSLKLNLKIRLHTECSSIYA